jgi:hypothetical protein
MKIIIKHFVCLILFINIYRIAYTQPSIEGSFGKIISDEYHETAVRYSLGITHIIKNKLGFYATLEKKGGYMPFTSNTYNNEFKRHILGMQFDFSNHWGFYGGLGVNLINPFQRDGNFITNRKELGIVYKLSNMSLLRFGYSKSVGFTANFGLRFPMTSSQITVHNVISKEFE